MRRLAHLSYLVEMLKIGSLSAASDNYWSSTTIVGNEDNAWGVNFNNGNDNWNNKDNTNYVRCVRARE
jgi:hypothetical protein